MGTNELTKIIAEADPVVRTEALAHMLFAHASPVFGEAKTVEHEVVAFLSLQRLGVIAVQPTACQQRRRDNFNRSRRPAVGGDSTSTCSAIELHQRWQFLRLGGKATCNCTISINRGIQKEERAAIEKQLKAQSVCGDDLTSLISSPLCQLGKHTTGKAGKNLRSNW